MKIQSLSICVPAKKCINNCKFCCVKMHESEYADQFSDNIRFYDLYENDYIKRMEFARDNGCNTCMITGDVEPQQNIPFLKTFGDMNNKLEKPFRSIEMQTTGAFIDDEKLRFFRNHAGITTISVSVSCLVDDKINRDIIGMKDANFSLEKLCKEIKKYDFNLRLSLNMTNCIMGGRKLDITEIINRCIELGADQVTFRKIYSSNTKNDADAWIKENVNDDIANSFFPKLNRVIKANGTYLDTLEYGADRYDYRGLSVVVDDDCMSKKVNKDAVKYLILRPNCKLYSKWDSKASLIF